MKVLAIGPGHDQAVTSLSVPGGGTINFSPALQRNWASVYGGATITAATEPSTPATAAVRSRPSTSGRRPAGPPTHTGPTSSSSCGCRRSSTSPSSRWTRARPAGTAPNSATGAYRVETSPDGTNWTVAHSGTFGTSARHVAEPRHADRRRHRRALRAAVAALGPGRRRRAVPRLLGVRRLRNAPSAPTPPRRRRRSIRAVRRSSRSRSRARARRSSAAWVPAAFAACTSPHHVGRWRTATYTFEVRARDAAGNVDPTPASRTFTIDTTAAGDDDHRRSDGGHATASFTFTSEAGATFECRLVAGGVRGVHVAARVGALADGTYTFAVRARDAAGNVDPTPGVADVHGRHGAAADDARRGRAAASFTFSARVGRDVRVPDRRRRAFAACTSPHNVGALADGTYTFEVRARDTAGNVDPTPASQTLTIDTTPPDTTIESGWSAGFTFSSEAGATFECRLGRRRSRRARRRVRSARSPTAPTRSRSASGTRRATSTRRRRREPSRSTRQRRTRPSGVGRSDAGSFTFSSEAGATFECRLGTAAFAACTSPHNVGAARRWHLHVLGPRHATRRATSTRPRRPGRSRSTRRRRQTTLDGGGRAADASRSRSRGGRDV